MQLESSYSNVLGNPQIPWCLSVLFAPLAITGTKLKFNVDYNDLCLKNQEALLQCYRSSKDTFFGKFNFLTFPQN